MSRQTRRQFLAGTAAAGLAGWRALHAQAPDPVPIPGLEVGEPTTSFALRNVTVIDATGKPALSGMTVLIAGNRIQSLGPVAATPVVNGVQAVDASGKFLLPGLWDMHSHLAILGATGQLSPLFIPNGVTGTRTMGGNERIVTTLLTRRAETAEGKRLGPRLVVASPTLTGALVATVELARESVRSAVASGVDCIKVHNAVPRESYLAIIEEARRLKVPVVGHVPNQPPDPVTIAECANAGQRSFEHMAGVFATCIS